MSNVYSVTQINAYIKNMFAQDYLLSRVSIQGEVSNCKYHSSGHVYFTLKDAHAAISCVLFAANRRGLTFRLTDGMEVVVSGSVSVFEKSGAYQIYVSSVRQNGIGALYERFEALKAQLGEMGMFDPAYKVPIPKEVRILGVVTAPTGAAVRDIIQISKRRNPGIRIVLFPAKVQGEGAADSVAAGIRALEQVGVDVIIVGRGGGSIEDLWAFNEEIVARAIFACSVPVISAVGHETDVVISDFVADLRAPTPSAAAELAVADMYEKAMDLAQRRESLDRAMLMQINRKKQQLAMLQKMLVMGDPKTKVSGYRLKLEERRRLLSQSMQYKITGARVLLEQKKARLDGLSPYRHLEQGYAFVTDERGGRISKAAEIQENQRLQMHFADGSIFVRVEEKNKTDIQSE